LWCAELIGEAFVSGVVFPNNQLRGKRGSGLGKKVWTVIWANRFFTALVVLPTLLVAFYFGLIASDQYESSADFIVRHAESPSGSGGLGQIMGFNFGSTTTVPEAYIVRDYLLSHDAVKRLQMENGLSSVFARPRTDWVSSLHYGDPERVLKYYRKQVNVAQDETSGVAHLSVKTFRPEDSRVLALKLMQMGEERINLINQRTYRDQVDSTQRELTEAERKLDDIQSQMTAYRRQHHDIDPESTGKAQLTLVTGVGANLVNARARLQAMEGVIAHSSPQYQALGRQVTALEEQMALQNSKLAGPGASVATRLGDYEQLVIQREEVAKIYAAAAVQFAQAKAEAKRKQLYLIRVVDPNMPVRSEYPKRLQTTLTVFAGLFFLYAIGWLLWAGVKEHSL
jgi:capsular polysaccharide transport system permease protein